MASFKTKLLAILAISTFSVNMTIGSSAIALIGVDGSLEGKSNPNPNSLPLKLPNERLKRIQSGEYTMECEDFTESDATSDNAEGSFLLIDKSSQKMLKCKLNIK